MSCGIMLQDHSRHKRGVFQVLGSLKSASGFIRTPCWMLSEIHLAHSRLSKPHRPYTQYSAKEGRVFMKARLS
jgi:hypothetical protein